MKRTGKKDGLDLTWETLKPELVEAFLFGVEARDKKGHSSWVKFPVRPGAMDQIERIRELAPPGWFKTKGGLYRGLINVGMQVALAILESKTVDTKEITDLREVSSILQALQHIERKNRVDGIKSEMRVLAQNLAGSTIRSREELQVQLAEIDEKLARILGDK